MKTYARFVFVNTKMGSVIVCCSTLETDLETKDLVDSPRSSLSERVAASLPKFVREMSATTLVPGLGS